MMISALPSVLVSFSAPYLLLQPLSVSIRILFSALKVLSIRCVSVYLPYFISRFGYCSSEMALLLLFSLLLFFMAADTNDAPELHYDINTASVWRW